MVPVLHGSATTTEIHTVLTDNGVHLADPRGASWTAAEITELIARKEPFRAHAFEYNCAKADIDHCLTKPNTNRQNS